MITIITPTYNRAYILSKCYESLIKQTNKSFEWIIIDDGSSDNTEEIVSNWILEGKLNITYKYQENQGKHVAHNLGVSLAKGKAIFCLDSDDQLTIDCIEKLKNIWCKVEKCEHLAGVVALKSYFDGSVVSSSFPSFSEVSTFDLYDKSSFTGDALFIYKADILKKFTFPIFKNEKFVTEALVYNRISLSWKMLLFNEVIYKCEYLEDGYSSNFKRTFLKNPKGFIVYHNEIMLMKSKKITLLKSVLNYIALSIYVKEYKFVKNSNNKFLTTIMLPFGVLLYFYKYRKQN